MAKDDRSPNRFHRLARLLATVRIILPPPITTTIYRHKLPRSHHWEGLFASGSADFRGFGSVREVGSENRTPLRDVRRRAHETLPRIHSHSPGEVLSD